MVSKNKESIERNLIFGIQDSLGSTLGFLSGIAVSGVSREVLLLSGTVLIFVEAFSMGVSSLISQHTVDELNSKRNLPLFKSLNGSIVMFFSYIFSGFIPLSPYIFFHNEYSLFVSIALTLIFLTIVGAINAKVNKLHAFHHIKELLLVGSIAVVVGITIGKLFPGM